MAVSRSYSKKEISDSLEICRTLTNCMQYEEALQKLISLHEKIKSKPIFSDIFFIEEILRAQCLFSLYRFEESLKVIEGLENLKDLTANQKDNVNRIYANLYLARYNTTQNYSDLEEIKIKLDLLPRNPTTKQLLADYFFHKKEYTNALNILSEINPKECTPKFLNKIQTMRALIYLYMGEQTLFLQTVKKIDPNSNSYTAKQLLVRAGYRNVIDNIKFPNSNNAKDYIQYAFIMENYKPKEAKRAFKMLLEKFPYEWKGYTTYAFFMQNVEEDYLKSNQILAGLEQRIKKLPQNSDLSVNERKHLQPSELFLSKVYGIYAINYFLLGNHEKAKEYLNRCEKLFDSGGMSIHAKNTFDSKMKKLYLIIHKNDPNRIHRLHGFQPSLQRSVDIQNLNDFPPLSSNSITREGTTNITKKEQSSIPNNNNNDNDINTKIVRPLPAKPKTWNIPVKNSTTACMQTIMQEQQQTKTKLAWKKIDVERHSLAKIMKEEEQQQSLIKKTEPKSFALKPAKEKNNQRTSANPKPTATHSDIENNHSKSLTLSTTSEALINEIDLRDNVLSETNSNTISKSEILPDKNQILEEAIHAETSASEKTELSKTIDSKHLTQNKFSVCNASTLFAVSAVALTVGIGVTYCLDSYTRSLDM